MQVGVTNLIGPICLLLLAPRERGSGDDRCGGGGEVGRGGGACVGWGRVGEWMKCQLKWRWREEQLDEEEDGFGPESGGFG